MPLGGTRAGGVAPKCGGCPICAYRASCGLKWSWVDYIFSIDISFLPIYTLYTMRMTQTHTGQEETETMTSSRLDQIITDAIKYHTTITDPLNRIACDRRITALIADRHDAIAIGN